MRQHIQREGPACKKCKRPTKWHSAQTVKTRDAIEVMDVYVCDTCGRLTAMQSVGKAAA